MTNQWGPWKLHEEQDILYQEDKGPHTDWITLSDCTTPAEVLDIIVHFSRKFPTSKGDHAIAEMVRALDDILDPMRTLCSGGKATQLRQKELRERISRARTSGRVTRLFGDDGPPSVR